MQMPIYKALWKHQSLHACKYRRTVGWCHASHGGICYHYGVIIRKSGCSILWTAMHFQSYCLGTCRITNALGNTITSSKSPAGHLLQHPGGGSACDFSRISGHILIRCPYQYSKSLDCYCSERCAWLFCLAAVPVWQTADAARLWTHHSDIHHCGILDLYMYACRVPDTTPRLYINLEKASGVRLTLMQF